MGVHFSKKAEIVKSIVRSLPVRRSQASNWAIKLLGINNNFIGKFLGKKIEVHPGDPASRSAYFLGFYERETTLWTIDFIKKTKPSVVFDVGANFGYFMYLCTTESIKPTIYSFEPDPYNQEWLKRNIELNSLKQSVKVIEKAVSSKNSRVSFIPSSPEDGKTLWSRIDSSKDSGESTIEVDAISLDAFCLENSIDSVDLVKIDIEGAEGFAIEGMKNGLRDKIYKNILLEVHPYALSEEHSPSNLVKVFTDNGYAAYQFKQSYNNVNVDKQSETYKLEWSEKYLEKVDPSSNMSDWEHFLFSAE